MYVCDACMVEKITNERKEPHIKYFGYMPRYVEETCGICGEKTECVCRGDVKKE